MVVELATDILFPSASATLSKEGKAAIAEVAGLLGSIPDRRYQVEGHTDNVPVAARGQYKSNWDLASARALTVLQTMTEAGLAPERISAASYGEMHPTKPNDSNENKAANRRIEIVVVPDLSSLPGFDELQRVEK
jgi:chemotaxis protein MotB